jgi:ribosome maturation factor RimP
LSLTGVELEVREEVRQLAQPLAEEAGVELVDVEFGAHGSRRILRVLLDKPGGVSVGDCAAFSRRLSDCLEMNQTVPGRYDLEVSSPGVDRPLRSLEVVQRFAGKRGAIALREPHEGRRNFEGELLAPADGRAGLRTDEGGIYWFEWAEVKSARLVADPWGEARSRRRTQ